MTMTTSPLKGQEPEQQAILITLSSTELRTRYPAAPVQRRQPIRSLAQISTEPKNTEVIEYYLPYRPIETNSGSITFADKFNNVDQEKVRNSNEEIAVYNTDLKERRSKFLSPTVSSFSRNLPRIYKKVEATNHQQKRSQELQVYLNSLKNEARETKEVEFSESVITLSELVWNRLKSSFDEKGLCLKVPDACPGLNNDFMYVWSNADHYLECEIFGTGEIEFFYRNRNNGRVWGEDTTLEQGFSTNILDKAALFIQ